jgi:hypothetical protein
MRFCFRHLPEN